MGFSRDHITTALDLLGVLLIIAGVALALAAAVGGVVGVVTALVASGLLVLVESWLVTRHGGGDGR